MEQLEASYEQHTHLAALRTVAFAVALVFLLAFAALALPQQQAQAATLTDGWEECGTCEWTISDGTLTIRPLGDGSTGTLGTKFGWTSTKKQSSFTKVVIESGVKTGASAKGMFKYCDKVTAISGIGELDVSKATNMKRMFYGCYKLKKLDLSGWSIAKVTSMSSMFAECKSLKKLNLAKWNTKKVWCMYNVFANCKSLTTLDISGWSTAKVSDLEWFYAMGTEYYSTPNMFLGCTGLRTVKVGAAFSFETTGSTLPTPVKGSKKGKWKSSSGVTYSSPSKIPSNKKATYKAVF